MGDCYRIAWHPGRRPGHHSITWRLVLEQRQVLELLELLEQQQERRQQAQQLVLERQQALGQQQVLGLQEQRLLLFYRKRPMQQQR
jgi:hypothetical protein